MDKVKLGKYIQQIEDATILGERLPMFISVLLKERDELDQLPPVEVCRMFEMKETYTHLVRSVFKVPKCMQKLGAKIT